MAALFLTLFFADRFMGAFGLLPPTQVNPPHLNELRKNVEFRYEFRTNALGFRYKDIPLKKSKSTTRVYVAGDSFTEGMGLDAEDTFSAILEKRYSQAGRAVNFINGGLAGTGPEEYGDIFLKVGLKYNPDGLLICLYANDLADSWKLPGVRRNPIKRWCHRFFPSLGAAWSRFKENIKPKTPSPIQTHDMIGSVTAEAFRRGLDSKQIEEWKSHLPIELVAAADRGEFAGDILSMGLLYPTRMMESLDINTPLAESKWQHMTNILSRVIDECRWRHIEVVLVFIPSELQYVPAAHDADNPWIVSGLRVRREWLTDETELQRRCEAWARKKELPYLDMTPRLRSLIAEGRQLNYSLDGHWNSEGSRAAADIIADGIDRGHFFGFIGRGETAGVMTTEKMGVGHAK